MKKIALIIIITFYGFLIKAQDMASERQAVIKAFISAILEKKPADFVIKKYMHLLPNDSVSKEKRETIIAAMQDSLLKTKGKILISSTYKVSRYDDFKGDKKRFNTDDNKDILILSTSDKPLIYFYFKENRILSFYYISKGDLSFFVVI